MNSRTWVGTVRIVSYIVLAAMLGSFVYATYIALTHWTGIGV